MLRCYFLLVALVSCAASVASQQVGTTICACSPSVYTFQFDFSYTCNQTTVSIGQGSGIADIDCFSQGLLRPGEDNATVTVTDTTPIRISAVDIIELDQSLAPIASAFYGAGYSNGDTIQYVSIAGNPTNASDLTAEQIPKAIQLSIVGTNAAEEDITNVWIILFDNECGFFEVLTPGDQIGWTNLVGLDAPLQTVCPLIEPGETTAPTSSVDTTAPSSSADTTAPAARVPCLPTTASSPTHKKIASSKSIGKGHYSKTRGSSKAVSSSSKSTTAKETSAPEIIVEDEVPTRNVTDGPKVVGSNETRRQLEAESFWFFEQGVRDVLDMSMSSSHSDASSKSGSKGTGASSKAGGGKHIKGSKAQNPSSKECIDEPLLPKKKSKSITSSKRGSKLHKPTSSKASTSSSSSKGKGYFASKGIASSKGESSSSSSKAGSSKVGVGGNETVVSMPSSSKGSTSSSSKSSENTASEDDESTVSKAPSDAPAAEMTKVDTKSPTKAPTKVSSTSSIAGTNKASSKSSIDTYVPTSEPSVAKSDSSSASESPDSYQMGSSKSSGKAGTGKGSSSAPVKSGIGSKVPTKVPTASIQTSTSKSGGSLVEVTGPSSAPFLSLDTEVPTVIPTASDDIPTMTAAESMTAKPLRKGTRAPIKKNSENSQRKLTSFRSYSTQQRKQ